MFGLKDVKFNNSYLKVIEIDLFSNKTF